MGKTLVVAEKPSVANDIVKALTPQEGRFDKHDDFYESDNYIVTSAVGHLVGISSAEEYDPKRGRWSFARLPVIPPYFALVPIDKTKSRLNAVVRLMKRRDVDTLINACDAGREGELIFGLIENYAGGDKRSTGKTIKRLWMQSMTPDAIRTAFKNLRSAEQAKPLSDAAYSRSEADWLVGINGTRAMTAYNSQDGGFVLTTVGRVQTPTLSLLVDRENKIKAHKAKRYVEVTADFRASAGIYSGKWFNPLHKNSPEAPELKADRIWSLEEASKILEDIRDKQATVTDESKPSSSISPPLFDLTSLQREASNKFGFSAKTTLSIAQALYEKHKCCTYPRTDSRYLPEDYVGTVKDTLGALSGYTHGGISTHAQAALDRNMVQPTKRVFDNTKVSDHFAVIPTKQLPTSLTEQELKIYTLVVRRFIAVFFPQAEFLLTTRISKVEQHHFKSDGKVMLKPGWTAIYGREDGDDKDKVLTVVTPGERPPVVIATMEELDTKPPARYTEATLLGAMENAGKSIDDAELKDAMKEKGLGTPATRAATIEGLISEQYMYREGKELIPTSKAFQLMTLLHALEMDELTKAELTGNWEYKLSLIEQGKLSRQDFMEQIVALTKRMVEKAKAKGSTFVPEGAEPLQSPCPQCGGKMVETYKRFSCTGPEGGAACGFSFGKTPASRLFSTTEAEELISQHRIGPLDGFKAKTGFPFSASMVIKNDPEKPGTLKVDFDFPERVVVQDTGEHIHLGKCPGCGGKFMETDQRFACEHVLAGNKKKCDVKISKVILQQPIATEQVRKILEGGKSDLLPGFVSSKTNKTFSAYLTWDKRQGRTGFEFEKKEGQGNGKTWGNKGGFKKKFGNKFKKGPAKVGNDPFSK